MAVSARWDHLSVSETADLLECSFRTAPIIYTELSEKTKKTFHEQEFCGWKRLLDARQSRMI